MESFQNTRNILQWSKIDFISKKTTNGDYSLHSIFDKPNKPLLLPQPLHPNPPHHHSRLKLKLWNKQMTSLLFSHLMTSHLYSHLMTSLLFSHLMTSQVYYSFPVAISLLLYLLSLFLLAYILNFQCIYLVPVSWLILAHLC